LLNVAAYSAMANGEIRYRVLEFDKSWNLNDMLGGLQ